MMFFFWGKRQFFRAVFTVGRFPTSAFRRAERGIYGEKNAMESLVGISDPSSICFVQRSKREKRNFEMLQ